MLDVVGYCWIFLDVVGCCWMLLGDVGMVGPPNPTNSRSRRRSLSRFEFTFLGRGKLLVQFAKCENQKSNESH